MWKIWLAPLKSINKNYLILLGVVLSGHILFTVYKRFQSIPDQDPVVQVCAVTLKDIPNILSIPSVLKATTEVMVRSRIDGMIKEIHFCDGAKVIKGQRLFSIDDDQLQAQYKQAESNWEKDKAQLAQARREAERHQPLLKKKFISQSAMDSLTMNVQTLEAAIKADEAVMKNIKLQIDYAKIHSPINGIAGFITIDVGNFVRQAENTPLVTIMDVHPLTVEFDIPEKYLMHLLHQNLENIHITLEDINGTPLNHKCHAVAIDQTVNPQAGVIKLKTNVENHEEALRPGMTVTGHVQIHVYKNALVIPQASLSTGQLDQYVFVYNPQDHTVVRRTVKIQEVIGEQVIVISGLTKGEMVVTNGQVRLKSGMSVKLLS